MSLICSHPGRVILSLTAANATHDTMERRLYVEDTPSGTIARFIAALRMNGIEFSYVHTTVLRPYDGRFQFDSVRDLHVAVGLLTWSPNWSIRGLGRVYYTSRREE